MPLRGCAGSAKLRALDRPAVAAPGSAPLHAYEIVILCGIVTAGFVCQWLAWRLKLPAILLLLIVGITLGPGLGWLDPDALLGDLLSPIVSIAVAIILFEGSLTLKLSEIRGHGNVVRNLLMFGVLVTWVCAGLAAWQFLGWDPYLAALFGAIVTVSGPTVVGPLLRTVRPSKTVLNVLKWESILIDPLGAILALLVFDFIIASAAGDGFTHVLGTFGTLILSGSLIGIAGGYLFGIAIRRRVVPDFLRDYAALAAVLAVYAAAEAVESEAGLLAVTVMGVWLSNMRHVELEDVLSFKESLTLLLVAGLFILLAARLSFDALLAMGTGAIATLAVLQLVAGPLRAAVCTIGSALNWRERLFVGWVFPRGIVAAAISAFFALRLVENGVPNAESLVPLVFSIIIGTVIIQSISTRALAKWLNVAAPEANGILVVGSNTVALMMAKALHDAGRDVVVADSNWKRIREARMLGLRTFYGSPVSSYADRNLDLTGLGILLAVSRRPDMNELACVRYSSEFGRDNVYTIGNESEATHEKHKISGESGGRILFGGHYTIGTIYTLHARGAQPRTTELTDEFGFAQYQEQHPGSLVLFAIDDRGRVVFPVQDEDFAPEEGWRVTALTKQKQPQDKRAES